MIRIIQFMLLVLVISAALPLGSNREWSWTLWAVMLASLAFLWGVVGLLRPSLVSRQLSPVLVTCFLVVCGWAWVQTQVFTPADWHHPLWQLNAEVLGTQLQSASTGQPLDPDAVPLPDSVSLSADDGYTALLRLMAYGLVFLLSFQLCRSSTHARTTLKWVAIAGFVFSMYGLAIYFSRSDSFLWFWELDWRSSVRATFVNRNSFATWLGLSLLCAMAWFFTSHATRRNPAYELPGYGDERLERLVLKVWKPTVMLIVMVAALILTHSRGGFLSALAGIVVFLLALNHRRSFKIRGMGLTAAALALAVLASFWVTSDTLLERLEVSSVKVDTRLKAYALAADGIDDNPVLGYGYGTFADSFRLYRSESLKAYFDKAHNTYLENIFELGWPAALLLFLCVAWVAGICVKGILYRGRDWVYPATGLAATALVAVHSLVDFSLQIPATAMLYALIMGMACAQSYSSRVR